MDVEHVTANELTVGDTIVEQSPRGKWSVVDEVKRIDYCDRHSLDIHINGRLCYWRQAQVAIRKKG